MVSLWLNRKNMNFTLVFRGGVVRFYSVLNRDITSHLFHKPTSRAEKGPNRTILIYIARAEPWAESLLILVVSRAEPWLVTTLVSTKWLVKNCVSLCTLPRIVAMEFDYLLYTNHSLTKTQLIVGNQSENWIHSSNFFGHVWKVF